jgi:hypothetical protein
VYSNEDSPKSVYNLVSNTINTFGINNNNNSNNNYTSSSSSNKLKMLPSSSSSKMHSSQHQPSSSTSSVSQLPPIHFTICDDNDVFSDPIHKNLLTPNLGYVTN